MSINKTCQTLYSFEWDTIFISRWFKFILKWQNYIFMGIYWFLNLRLLIAKHYFTTDLKNKVFNDVFQTSWKRKHYYLVTNIKTGLKSNIEQI